MAATVPSGLIYPVGSDTAGNLRDHIKDLADSTQAALTRQANAYTGTNAERLAHTPYASNGTLWSNTDEDERVYQFRKGQWFPEYQEVSLESAYGGNPLFDISSESKLHVNSFGRSVTLQGTFNSANRNQVVAEGGQIDLARVPAEFCPPASLYGVTWGRGQKVGSKITHALLRYAVNYNSGDVNGRRILVRVDDEEGFRVHTSGSFVTFTVTWSIPNSRWEGSVFPNAGN